MSTTYYNQSVTGQHAPFVYAVPDVHPSVRIVNGLILLTVSQDGDFETGDMVVTCDSETDAVFDWTVEIKRGGRSVASYSGPSPIEAPTIDDLADGDSIAVTAGGLDAGAQVDVACGLVLHSTWASS